MKKTFALLTTGLLITALSAQAPAKPAPRRAKAAAAAPALPAGPRWDQTITLSEQGFPVMGNPAAQVKVVEFISMTCPHCADFAQESKLPLAQGLVRQGKVSVEMRPFIRVALDEVPSLLAVCGDKSRYFGNEAAILGAQKSWFKKPADPGYAARWEALESNKPAQRKAVAQDLGLYKFMLARGYTAKQLDACLADDARLKWLNDQTTYASTAIGVDGTPSFTINGVLQPVYAWEPLKPRIDAALALGAAQPAATALPEIPESRRTGT